MNTIPALIIGFFFAIMANIPIYSWVMLQEPSIFPLEILGLGLRYMAIFFHEIGHTLAAWFYGYPALPMFDFKHGGGMAVFLGGSNFIIVMCVWLFLAYSIYSLREYKAIFYGLICLLLFNFATFWNEEWRMSLVDFMGPALEAIIAGFFITRAVFNLAPRGSFERILNAVFGFGMIFRILIESYGLIAQPLHRLAYLKQKGGHGFGDFDKIADRFYGVDFEMVVYAWLGLTILCLLMPFTMIIFTRSE